MKLGVVAAVVSAVALADLAAAAEAPEHECDYLAAHPADPARVAPGVQWDVFDARPAIQACQQAVKQFPDSLRLQFQLGRALLRAQRRDEALPYLIAVADKGYLIAYSNIGGTYQFDLGNVSEALKWYRRGADAGDESSWVHLAELYLEGHGVERNLGEALRWYTMAAERSNAIAEYKIGLIYQRGDKSIPRDHAKAIAWFSRAAAHGAARGQNDLGWAYEAALGVKKDLVAAARWYRLAAEQGWALAQLNLARLYEAGQGVPADIKEAFYWYRKASDARIPDIRDKARAKVADLGRGLSPAQLAEVDERANKWRQLPPEDTMLAARRVLAQSGLTVDVAYVPPTPAAQAKPAVDPGYAPPTAQAKPAVDPGYAPTPAKPGVDKAYVPPQLAAVPKGAGADSAYRPPAPAQMPLSGSARAKPVTGGEQEPAPALAPLEAASLRQLAGINFGRYHALVIGNKAYRNIAALETPINDAKAVTDVLQKDYGFQVTVLVDATRAHILTALTKLRGTLTPEDNLLIYYAGHGVIDEVTQRGYWLPIDAEEFVPTNWMSSTDLTDMIRAINAKHILVVSDSCYSGTLVRDASVAMPRERAAWIQRIVTKRARTVLASGGLEPVADSGIDKSHSIFAKAFLDALRDNPDVMDGQTLFARVKRPVVLNSNQTPEYADIRSAGHDGGDFVFVRPPTLRK